MTIGAICSAVIKKNGLYVFFDSHSHGENGLSSSDGASSLITFSNLNDLVTYLYAFYDSMKLDTYLQFDFLPMNVRKCEDKRSYKDEMASHMEAYFNDQRLKQAMKTQSNVRSIPYDLSSISIKVTKNLQGQKERSFALSIIKTTKDNLDKTQCLNPKKFCIRRNQSNQPEKNPGFKTKERESKQSERRNPVFRERETVYQRESKQSERRNPVFMTKERESNQSERRNPVLGQKKENQSNQKGETLFLGQKLENQSNQKGETLFLGQRKENQSNQKGETLFLGQKKEDQSS